MMLPSAMLASVRCRTHVASASGRSTGASGVVPLMRRTCAPPSAEQAPVYRPSASAHGVLAVIGGKPICVVSAPIVVPGANGALGSTLLSGAEPPPTAAGLVHRTSVPLGSPVPNRAPVRPKSELAGGTSLNVEKAMTHPSWVAERQARTCWKSPPTSLPFLTSTLP